VEAKEEEDRLAKIEAALAELPPQRKKIVIDSIAGLSPMEIAEKMKLSRQTVLNHRQRGLQQLRKICTGKDWIEEIRIVI
jgi:RNA polymerase sigma factor (sigma-70 family)